MISEISNCSKCNLCKNQKPLLDNTLKCDIVWVGLSAKKVNDVIQNIPLDNDTNSGKIIGLIESRLANFKFYKTNLVKCLPLDENHKLRYPNQSEMTFCLSNLLLEINTLHPKIIFALGKKTYNFIYKYFTTNHLDTTNLIYIEHPSYIYVYKRKYIDEYVNKIVNICNTKLTK